MRTRSTFAPVLLLFVASCQLLLREDAGGNATPQDAGALIDGAAGRSFCAARARDGVFCQDFDGDAAAPTFGFNATVGAGATGELDAQNYVSPPFALAWRAGVTDAGGLSIGLERFIKVPTTSPLHLEFRVSMDSGLLNQVGYTSLARIVLTANRPRHIVYLFTARPAAGESAQLRLGEEVPRVDGGVAYPPTRSLVVPRAGTWLHVALDLVDHAVTVAIDGKTLVDKKPLDDNGREESVSLQLGLLELDAPTSGVSVTVDDVLFGPTM